MDDGIGRIIDALDRKHLRENTLLVFASDNGGNLPAASNQPFRDQKGSVYEGGVHVLALANWPGHLPKGTTVDQPLHMTDWFVTLLKVAGAALPADAGALDGRDLWPALNGNRAPVHEDILINAAPGSGALRRGDWKLVVNGQLRYKAGTPAPGFSWADLLEETGLPRELASRNQVELFNLAQDPGEAHDLAAAKPDLTRELKARYDAYEKEAVPLVGSEVVKDFKAPPVWGEFPDKEKD
jgi:arylsulfatase A-like enzyme